MKSTHEITFLAEAPLVSREDLQLRSFAWFHLMLALSIGCTGGEPMAEQGTTASEISASRTDVPEEDKAPTPSPDSSPPEPPSSLLSPAAPAGAVSESALTSWLPERAAELRRQWISRRVKNFPARKSDSRQMLAHFQHMASNLKKEEEALRRKLELADADPPLDPDQPRLWWSKDRKHHRNAWFGALLDSDPRQLKLRLYPSGEEVSVALSALSEEDQRVAERYADQAQQSMTYDVLMERYLDAKEKREEHEGMLAHVQGQLSHAEEQIRNHSEVLELTAEQHTDAELKRMLEEEPDYFADRARGEWERAQKLLRARRADAMKRAREARLTPKDRLSDGNVKRLHHNMSLREAQAILGPGGERSSYHQSSSGAVRETYIWDDGESGGRTAHCRFEDGELKSFNILD